MEDSIENHRENSNRNEVYDVKPGGGRGSGGVAVRVPLTPRDKKTGPFGKGPVDVRLFCESTPVQRASTIFMVCAFDPALR